MNRIGLESYSLHPLGMQLHEILGWAHDNGAESVLFSGLAEENYRDRDISYLRDLGQMARDLGLYIEWGGGRHIPFEMDGWSRTDLMPLNLKAIKEANAIGTRIIRSCSDHMQRANPGNPHTHLLMKATVEELVKMMPMLRDNGVVLAIETHFEFTSFELLKIFDMCEAEPGDCLGICLDTMNLLTMLEVPDMAAERLMPWVVCTHIKDGGLVFGREGMTAFPSSVGTGIINLEKIVSLIKKQPHNINLSVEDHGGNYLLPIHEPWYINQFPDLTISEYNSLMLLEDNAERLMIEGLLEITPVSRWPEVCEERTRGNLKKIREIYSRCG